MSWRHVTATNRFMCTGEFLWLVAATKFCCRGKDFYKISPVHTKWFVAVMCHHSMLLQLVAGPVHTEWSLSATCCCNFLPCVYRPLYDTFSSSLQHYVCPRDEPLVHWIKDELWYRHYNLHAKCLAIQKDPDGVEWFHHSYLAMQTITISHVCWSSESTNLQCSKNHW